MWWNETKTLLLHTQVGWMSQEKALARLCEVWVELTFFSWKIIFAWKNWQTHYDYFDLSIWHIFSNINEVNLSFQGKQLTVLVPSDKIWAFKWKLEFWKTCSSYSELNSFPKLKGFLLKPMLTVTVQFF